MKISFEAVVPLPPDQAFAFVSDPGNWPRFIDLMKSAEAGPDWGTIGGHATTVSTMLGRTFQSDLEVTVWDPPREFRYKMRQPGRPDLDNHRVFVPVPGGTRLQGTNEGRLRGGLAGLTDRVIGWMLQRSMNAAMAKLPEVASASSRRAPQ